MSFDVQAGEVHALVGENGAGKSTLIKIITGAHAPDSGSVTIDGLRVDQFDPILCRRLGVAAVYQQPTLFPDLTVAENLAYGTEAVDQGSWPGWINWGSRRRRAQQLLERIGASISLIRLLGN